VLRRTVDRGHLSVLPDAEELIRAELETVRLQAPKTAPSRDWDLDSHIEVAEGAAILALEVALWLIAETIPVMVPVAVRAYNPNDIDTYNPLESTRGY